MDLDFLKAIEIVKDYEDVDMRYVALNYILFEIVKYEKQNNGQGYGFKKLFEDTGVLKEFFSIQKYKSNLKKYKLCLLLIFMLNNVLTKIELLYKQKKNDIENNNKDLEVYEYSESYKKFLINKFIVFNSFLRKESFYSSFIRSNLSDFLIKN